MNFRISGNEKSPNFEAGGFRYHLNLIDNQLD
jgi:hypothetical protein